MIRRLGWLVAVVTLAAASAAAQTDYQIDIPDLDRKPYSVGGFAELRPVVFRLDPDAALYGLRFAREPGVTTSTWQANARLQLDAGYRWGATSVQTRTVFDAGHSYRGWAKDVTSYEAYLSIKPSPSFTLDVGKKTLKWGKGYVWNPAAFLDRPKDPDDPALALEGLVVVSTDVIRSFDGPLRTVSFSPVLIPVFDHVNKSFGRTGHVNAAGRLYLLLYDTDVDVMFLAGGSRPGRVGLDVSRNLASNLEIHGEMAWIPDARRVVLEPDGGLATREADAFSLVAGLRYLAVTNTTIIVDVYRNGSGYTSDELRDFFAFTDRAAATFDAIGVERLLGDALRAGESGYVRATPGRGYLYGRMSQPDAFGVLYLNAAVTTILNLDDRSFSVTPELTFRAMENLELRGQVGVLAGRDGTEFGEKQADLRLEVRARYYF